MQLIDVVDLMKHVKRCGMATDWKGFQGTGICKNLRELNQVQWLQGLGERRKVIRVLIVSTVKSLGLLKKLSTNMTAYGFIKNSG